jgi:hypothetical protein
MITFICLKQKSCWPGFEEKNWIHKGSHCAAFITVKTLYRSIPIYKWLIECPKFRPSSQKIRLPLVPHEHDSAASLQFRSRRPSSQLALVRRPHRDGSNNRIQDHFADYAPCSNSPTAHQLRRIAFGVRLSRFNLKTRNSHTGNCMAQL